MITTRIAYSKKINPGKYAGLQDQAKRLGAVRSEVWQRFGSVNGVCKTDRQIRNQWLEENRQFSVLANPWKETLRDAMGDISASCEAAKVKARQAINRHTRDENERKRLYSLLKSNRWTEDTYLRRIMRKYWRRGHNHTTNQIIVRSDNYSTFKLGDQVWLKIPGLEKRKTISIPLNTTVAPTGTLRLILRDDVVEVHYSVEVEKKIDCGTQTLGIDKGYTEVLTALVGRCTFLDLFFWSRRFVLLSFYH